MGPSSIPGSGGLTALAQRFQVSGSDLDHLTISTIRTLAMDAVQASNSDHHGTPMAMATTAYWLWQRFLRFDPRDPIWPNRDRFVLSIGHASMLLYSLLHLAEVQAVDAEYERVGRPSVSLKDIQRFRQLDSRCPGTPRVPLDVRRGNHHGVAWPGCGDERRHGGRRALAGVPVQSVRLPDV
jgi:transketolase-like protein